jgi:hypothetical protein
MLVSPRIETDPIATLREAGPWLLHGQDVPLTRQYRYLGIEITDDLSLNQHIETNRLKAVGAITIAYLEAIMPTRLQILQSLRQA